jgi:hypothetical protein
MQGQGHTGWDGLPLAWGKCEALKAKAAIRAEVMNWCLGDATVDPGEVLLRLVTQSAARAEIYARLLQEAFEAVAAGLAERTVRIAERQGQLMVEMVEAALREVDLSPENRQQLLRLRWLVRQGS